MNVTITAIDQSYSLKTGEVTNFAVIRMPSGRVVRVALSEEDTQSLLVENSTPYEEASDSDPVESQVAMEQLLAQEVLFQPSVVPSPTPAMDPTRESGWKEPFYEHHVEEGVVEWEKLPDTQLPPQMKQVMRTAGINQFISIKELDDVKKMILERMSKKPKPGQVDWSGGSQAAGPWDNFKTVPRDEAGNPIPPGGIIEADPGELSDGDDDDGVGQL